jgi:hypothetical protein
VRVHLRVLVVLMTALTVAGCGSTKSSTSTGTTTAAAGGVTTTQSGASTTTGQSGGLTKAQYVTRADAVCVALQGKTRALVKRAIGLRAAISEVTSLSERANRELQAIPKPTPAKLPSEWLHARELVTADTKRTLQSAQGSAANAAANAVESRDIQMSRALAREYGLTACASL